MCELFGASSREEISYNELLQTFFSHSVNHPDGWGLALFRSGVSIEKEPVSAVESAYLKARLTDEIVEDVLLAHIRKASVGNLSYRNSHPFTLQDSRGRQWTLIHNGTIFECPALESCRQMQKGATDSERILYYLVERINGGGADTPLGRYAIVEDVICTITPENKVNLLIYDGELLYVHCNHRKSLYLWQRPGTLVVSTQPLNQEAWIEAPLNTLLVYRRGELVYTGKPHSHEYVKLGEEEPSLLPGLTGGLGI